MLPTQHHQADTSLPSLGVAQEVGRSSIEGRGVDCVEHALSDTAFSSIRINDTQFFELLKVPQHSFVTSTNFAANVPGG